MRCTKSTTDVQEALEQILQGSLDEHYWLAFLITGDRNLSVQALTSALDIVDTDTNETFRSFTCSWARKLILAEALGTIHSQLRESMLRTQRAVQDGFENLCSPSEAVCQNISKRDLER